MHSKIAFVVAIALTGCGVDDESATTGTASGGGKADGATAGAGFLGSLPGWGRYIALDKLDEIVPPYLAETRSVLAKIDALPVAVAETTALDQVPIPDLFEPGNLALSAVLNDVDFVGGRSEHDVAWLRQSAVELDAMKTAVTQLIGDGTSPASFDAHLTNTKYWQHSDGALEIRFGVNAVSRFYCGLDVRITNDPDDGFLVDASETCD